MKITFTLIDTLNFLSKSSEFFTRENIGNLTEEYYLTYLYIYNIKYFSFKWF